MKKSKPARELEIIIYGRCSARLRKIIEDACEYYLKLMMPRHKYDRLRLHIHFKTRKGMKGDEGTCLVMETDSRNTPYEFELEINRDNNTKTILYNLAHELVHVKQFALRELDEAQTKWFGKHVDDDKVDYWDLPWEIDAYGRERGLYTRFVREFKLDTVDEEFLFV